MTTFINYKGQMRSVSEVIQLKKQTAEKEAVTKKTNKKTTKKVEEVVEETSK